MLEDRSGNQLENVAQARVIDTQKPDDYRGLGYVAPSSPSEGMVYDND